jgi:hypothetical protein
MSKYVVIRVSIHAIPNTDSYIKEEQCENAAFIVDINRKMSGIYNEVFGKFMQIFNERITIKDDKSKKKIQSALLRSRSNIIGGIKNVSNVSKERPLKESLYYQCTKPTTYSSRIDAFKNIFNDKCLNYIFPLNI